MFNPRSESSHLLGFNSNNEESQSNDSENTDGGTETQRYVWDTKGKTGVRMKKIRKPKPFHIHISPQLEGELEIYGHPPEDDSMMDLAEHDNESAAHSTAESQVPEDNANQLQVLENIDIAQLHVYENDNASQAKELEVDNGACLQVPVNDSTMQLPTIGNYNTVNIKGFENDGVDQRQVIEKENTDCVQVLEDDNTGQSQVLENDDKDQLKVLDIANTDEMQVSENGNTIQLQLIEDGNDASLPIAENDSTVQLQTLQDNNTVQIKEIEHDGETQMQVIGEDKTDQTLEDDNTGQLQVLENIDMAQIKVPEYDNTDKIQVSENDSTTQIEVLENDDTAGLQVHSSDNNAQAYSKMSSIENKQDFSLIISNIPTSWNFEQIDEYIRTECGPVNGIEIMCKEDLPDIRDVKINFPTKEQMQISKTILDSKPVEGVKFDSEYDWYFEDEGSDRLEDHQLDIWEFDPEGLYGMRPEFLETLHIKPPINNWVHITNFRCEKSELRDALEIAGRVLFCTVISVYTKYAKVMYSHPLEAVQAISMLDGQKFYGDTLKVTMDGRTSKMIILPKGLKKLGPGLGRQGKIITNIAKHYERFLKNQPSLINPKIFTKIDRSDVTHDKTEDVTATVNTEDATVRHQIDNENSTNEGKPLVMNTSKQDTTKAVNQTEHSQSNVSYPVKTLNRPILPLQVTLTSPAVRDSSLPYFRPPLPRPVNAHISLAHLPPAKIRRTLFHNTYFNSLVRSKSRASISRRLLHRFRAPQNGGSPGSLPRIPESPELSPIGAAVEPGSISVGVSPPVSTFAGPAFSGTRSFETSTSGPDTIESRLPEPIFTGYVPSTSVGFGAPASGFVGSGVTGPSLHMPSYSGHGVFRPGQPGLTPINFPPPVSYPHVSRLPGPASYSFNRPTSSFVGSRFTAFNPLWISTSGLGLPELQAQSVSAANPLYYGPPVSLQPPGPNPLEFSSSGPGLLAVGDSGNCLLQYVPPGPLPYPGPSPPKFVITDSGHFAYDISGASLLQYRPPVPPRPPGPEPLERVTLDPSFLGPEVFGANSLKYAPPGSQRPPGASPPMPGTLRPGPPVLEVFGTSPLQYTPPGPDPLECITSDPSFLGFKVSGAKYGPPIQQGSPGPSPHEPCIIGPRPPSLEVFGTSPLQNRPPRPSNLESIGSGSRPYGFEVAGSSPLQYKPPGPLRPTVPNPLEPITSTLEVSENSFVQYRPTGLERPSAPSSFESFTSQSGSLESGPVSIGDPCHISTPLETEKLENALIRFKTPVSSVVESGLSGSGPLWYTTSGPGLGFEASAASPIECISSSPIRSPRQSPLETLVPMPSLPPTSTSFQSPASGRSRSQGYHPSQFSGFASPRYSPVGSGSHDLKYQASGPQSNLKPPFRYTSIPEVKLDIEDDEELLRMRSIEPEASTSNLLSNLPPNTTLQMLCDNLNLYEEGFTKNDGQ